MRWGLIGASNIASEWVIDAIRAQPGHEIAAVMSADMGRAKAYAARHGIARPTDDLEAITQDPGIDAVYISTTNEKHHAQALAAVAGGKHILCEKPLAMSVADAVEMVRAARDAGLVFATNHHLRNSGGHLAIKALLAKGRIGRILSVRVFHAVNLPRKLHGWRINDASAGGGVIPDIVVHVADCVRFHLEEDPADVVAMAGSSGLGDGVEDSVMTTWAMPSGIMVQAHASFTHAFAGNGFEVHGTEGSIVARGVMGAQPGATVTLIDQAGEHAIEVSDHGVYIRALERFATAARGGDGPAADGVDGVKSLAVAMAVRAAAQDGTRMQVDYGGI